MLKFREESQFLVSQFMCREILLSDVGEQLSNLITVDVRILPVDLIDHAMNVRLRFVRRHRGDGEEFLRDLIRVVGVVEGWRRWNLQDHLAVDARRKSLRQRIGKDRFFEEMKIDLDERSSEQFFSATLVTILVSSIVSIS